MDEEIPQTMNEREQNKQQGNNPPQALHATITDAIFSSDPTKSSHLTAQKKF